METPDKNLAKRVTLYLVQFKYCAVKRLYSFFISEEKIQWTLQKCFLTPQFFAPYYILFSYLQYQALLFCPVMDLLHPLLSFSTPTLWFWVPSCYPTCHELPWVTSPSKGHWHIRELSGHLPQHVLPLSMHKKSAFLLNAFHSNYLKGSQSPSLTGSPVPLKKGKQGKEGAKYRHVTRLVGVGVEEDWQEGVIGHIRAEQKVEL